MIPFWTKSLNGKIYAGTPSFSSHRLQKHNVLYWNNKISYVLADVVVEGLGPCRYLDVGWQVEVLHVMWTVSLFLDVPLACWTECLDSVELTLLHLHIRVGLDAGDGLASVNLVWIDRMAIEVLDNFDLMNLSVDLNFVGLHGLLDSLPDLS